MSTFQLVLTQIPGSFLYFHNKHQNFLLLPHSICLSTSTLFPQGRHNSIPCCRTICSSQRWQTRTTTLVQEAKFSVSRADTRQYGVRQGTTQGRTRTNHPRIPTLPTGSKPGIPLRTINNFNDPRYKGTDNVGSEKRVFVCKMCLWNVRLLFGNN